MNKPSFGETIKQLRVKKNLSQKDLASMLGICNTTLSQYEKNKRAPKFETLLKLAEILGVSTDYLLNARSEQDQYGSFQVSDLRQLERLKSMHKNLYNQVLFLADISPENQETIYRMLFAYLSMFNSVSSADIAKKADEKFYADFGILKPQSAMYVSEDEEEEFNKE